MSWLLAQKTPNLYPALHQWLSEFENLPVGDLMPDYGSPKNMVSDVRETWKNPSNMLSFGLHGPSIYQANESSAMASRSRPRQRASKSLSSPSRSGCLVTACRCWRIGWPMRPAFGLLGMNRGGRLWKSNQHHRLCWGSIWALLMWSRPREWAGSACCCSQCGTLTSSSKMCCWAPLKGKSLLSTLAKEFWLG